jgi:uncharacterized protein with PQ loop repeat
MGEFIWTLFSYLGFFFAILYRLPQIYKIYKSKKASDLSLYSYALHNGAYISFIIYLVGTNKTNEWALCSYYFMGITQNIIILSMKLHYNKTNKINTNTIRI